MSLTYPIAENGRKALTDPRGLARTKAEASLEAGQAVSFETDWLRPGEEDAAALQTVLMTAISQGAAQIYEAEKGGLVIAISYWKLTGFPELPEVRVKAGESRQPREDHADDLYFRRGRTKTGMKKETDPNQLDLFASPKADRPER